MDYSNYFEWRYEFPEVLDDNGDYVGFDVVIGNPPYINTKEIDENYKKALKLQYGFADDLYSHFFFKGIEIIKDNGILSFITSKTYWTIQTKKNLREFLLKNKIIEIYDTGNPFAAAMVDTAIIILQKLSNENNYNNYQFKFKDGKNDFLKSEVYTADIDLYKYAPNNVFYIPNDKNQKIANKYFKTIHLLLNKWWDKISTSKNIEKNESELNQYRATLKPGDITLLGLITEGGVGLQTGDNSKYIGVKEGTKWADLVRKQRPEKLLLDKEFCKQHNLKNKNEAEDYLSKLNELEIRNLFDEIKDKYGRDVFGQGWLYRIVSDDEIADVDSLTDDEKLNGIDGKRTFVPYDKGDKEGNRWWAPTPYYIDWSKENVKFLKTNSGKKGEGMPVVRNPQFYFKEGFCWNLINSTRSTVDLKVRFVFNSIYDVGSMRLSSIFSGVPNYYIISIINSFFENKYAELFLNFTLNFQINDARQLPIVIPNSEQLNFFEKIFNSAVSIQKDKFAGNITEKEAEKNLNEIQKELDKFVDEMYLD